MNPGRHRSKSLRLQEYDYSAAGIYFLTLCTFNRESLFGAVREGVVQDTEPSRIVTEVWLDLPESYADLTLDAFVVMPDHVHGIIQLQARPIVRPIHELARAEMAHPEIARADWVPTEWSQQARPFSSEPCDTSSKCTESSSSTDETTTRLIERRRMVIPRAIGRLKTVSAHRINQWRGTPGCPVWQSDYYEHIIRSEQELERARRYIQENPARWTLRYGTYD